MQVLTNLASDFNRVPDTMLQKRLFLYALLMLLGFVVHKKTKSAPNGIKKNTGGGR